MNGNESIIISSKSTKDMFEYWKANRKHLIDIHHGRKDFEG